MATTQLFSQQKSQLEMLLKKLRIHQKTKQKKGKKI